MKRNRSDNNINNELHLGQYVESTAQAPEESGNGVAPEQAAGIQMAEAAPAAAEKKTEGPAVKAPEESGTGVAPGQAAGIQMAEAVPAAAEKKTEGPAVKAPEESGTGVAPGQATGIQMSEASPAAVGIQAEKPADNAAKMSEEKPAQESEYMPDLELEAALADIGDAVEKSTEYKNAEPEFNTKSESPGEVMVKAGSKQIKDGFEIVELDENIEERKDSDSQGYRAPAQPVYKKPKKKMKGYVKAIIIIVIILTVIYAGGVVYGKYMFYPNTQVNGVDIGFKKAEDIDAMLIQYPEQLVITERGGQETINPQDFDYDVKLSVPASQLLAEQNIFAWPITVISGAKIEDPLIKTYDKDKLVALADNLDAVTSEDVKEPKDAYIGKGSSGQYEIIEADEGNKLDVEKTENAVLEAVDSEKFSVDLEEAGCYLQPSKYSDDAELNEKLPVVQALNGETITINMTGANEVLDPLKLVDFVYLDEYGNIYINEEYMDTYMQYLVKTYNTYMTKRNFKTHAGKTIQVGGSMSGDENGDTYGFLLDEYSTRYALEDAILGLADKTIDAVWEVPAIARNTTNGDIGYTYIEISLSEQMMWYYEDGKLSLETPVVTGLPNGVRNTPEGLFRAYDKSENAHLTGELQGESWDTYVAYWISVTWTAVGIHDATWQPWFGGDRYTYAGSHGCINTPYDAMAELFSKVAIDTPIVIY